ncbi:hypothetical protein BY458DRAFT_511516 [Sporodiniella umbellata]|nr:hypothetical protein BY458DRAFT_511516 [Sporodiniella umbellata]
MTTNVSSNNDSLKKMTCEQCKKRGRLCDTQRPCTHCIQAEQDCAYSVLHDGSRSIFSTQTAKRLGSGSACETCRKRKTKCDGGSPCGFCASNGIECLRRPTKKQPVDTIERIEDRLRRIERLMGAFAPSTLAQPSETYRTRPQRHTVQGVNPAREMINRTSPPPSQSITHSMLDLSISSSRTQIPFSSISTPSTWSPTNNECFHRLPSPPDCRNDQDWQSTIPSLMDQLSKRTFATTTTQEYHYPIYPITPPSSKK